MFKAAGRQKERGSSAFPTGETHVRVPDALCDIDCTIPRSHGTSIGKPCYFHAIPNLDRQPHDWNGVNLSQNEQCVKQFQEDHCMRYFFMPEIQRQLKDAGFRSAVFHKWLSVSDPLDVHDWSGVVVAIK